MSDQKQTQENTTELQIFDSVSFLSNIEKADTLQKKVKILNTVLNQPPIISKNMKEELKKNGINASKSQDYDYIPIGAVEEALRQIFFRQIDFKIVQSYRDLNTFIVVCCIKYKDPISMEYREIDGIGAKSIQQDSGAKIDSFNFTMKANGLELAVGIAYSRAVKNAAKKLGVLFGSGLNRDDEAENIVIYSKSVLAEKANKWDDLKSLFESVKDKLSEDDIIEIESVIKDKNESRFYKTKSNLEML